MHLTSSLFSAEEAFARLGQIREMGCLVIVSAAGTSRIFTRDACVVHAVGEGQEGNVILEKCFADMNASYVWLPSAKPPKEDMNVSIIGHALGSAIAKDIHLSRTSKVDLDSVDPSIVPLHKRSMGYSLLMADQPGSKLPFTKSAMTLGRDESCDVVIAKPQLSRRHCLLQLSARGLSFKDLESANGVFVNGIRGKGGFLHSGDRLSLADYDVHVYRSTD